MAPGLLGQGLVILRGAAQNLALFFLPLAPSTRGLVLGGAEGEEKANQGPVGSSFSSGWRGQQLRGPEDPLGDILVLAWEGVRWVVAWCHLIWEE